uniref:Golgi apparatus membrane protein TVP38 n=1 Tax=Blastobotrys adeninivorans TaxID=409370 RepID=A0A060SZH3_BLAAD
MEDYYQPWHQTWKARAETTLIHAKDIYVSLSPLKRALVWIAGITAPIVGILFLIFHDDVFRVMVSFAQAWKNIPGGGFILFALILLVSFPPLIGYSALSSMCGMMYGFPWGWPILAGGTVLGSLLSFLAFRYLFAHKAKQLAHSSTKFAALTSTLEQDRFTLLWMIRLCPLPYSLSNGALSSIPSVTPTRFVLATAATTPKLFMHIFIGDRLARLGTEKDTATKIVDFVSIILTVVVGSATAYIIYNRTMDRANAIELQNHHHTADEDYFPVDDEFELSDDPSDHYSDDERV